MDIFRGTISFVLAAVMLFLFDPSVSSAAEPEQALAHNTLISNAYFVDDESITIPGEKQGFGGALLMVKNHLIEIQRKGEIFEIDQQTLVATRQSATVPYTEIEDRSFGERGLTGVKGAAFDWKNRTLYVSTVEVQENCAYSKIYALKVRSWPFALDNPTEFLSLDDCVPVPPLPADFPKITAAEKFQQPNLSQGSGKIITLNNGNLLWSIGNFGDKWRDSTQMMADEKDPSVFWGKTLEISTSKQIQIFTLGHRNIQGLYQSPNGDIVVSEHGPEGGDELNILERGNNYGWPFISLGHDYSFSDKTYVTPEEFPLQTGIRNAESTAPLFAWVPAVAPSQVIQVWKNSKFTLWQNNFLMGTLKDASIRRIVINPENGSVILDEKIPVGMRVRDMTWGSSETSIFVLSDDSSVHKLTLTPRIQ